MDKNKLDIMKLDIKKSDITKLDANKLDISKSGINNSDIKKSVTKKMDSEKNKTFEYFVLNEFCKKYNINKDFVFDDPLYNFRYLCLKFNYFIKHITLPKIAKNSLKEAVFIEFRDFPHAEFIIRNAILKLGSEWCYTIICGNLNYNMILDICSSISPNINIININCDNINQSEYSIFLTKLEFWNMLKGEKILIYQEDSIIFKKNINDFLEYDFIGAPFPKVCDDTPNSVGNGGLSLRSKSVMIDIIKRFRVEDCTFNSSTEIYMKNAGLDFPPEDVYFSKCMQENHIGIVANWQKAYDFSSESIFNSNSFGGHKFWLSTTKWKEHMKKTYMFRQYIPSSNIEEYLDFIKKPKSFNKNNEISNAFDIDLYFFCRANNFEYTNINVALNYVKTIGLHGLIYHPKQVKNIYPDVVFYEFMNNIYVFHTNTIYTLQNFIDKYVYNVDFDILSEVLIKKKYSCLNDNLDLLILVFIGNEDIGIDLLKRIIKYKNMQIFNISICFNSSKLLNSDKLKKLIKSNFDFYSIYQCKEMGTDITPTILMYNEIIKKHTFKHILKFHTKSIQDIYLYLTNYLLSMPVKKLLLQKIDESNCIGHPSYYTDLTSDIFNNNLKRQHVSKIDINKKFVAGTIFYIPNEVLNSVLNFIKKNNYRSYLLNNLYENNSINLNYSPIHFLERLFGIINL
jgi:hypothetical protein